MPTTIQNDAGEDVEVFTQEELDARASETADAKIAEQKEQMEAEVAAIWADKEAELLETQEKLQKLQDKEMNFGRVARGAAKKDDVQKNLEEKMAQLETQIATISKQPIEEAKSEFLAKNIGGNKELQDKFDIFYAKLSADVKTKSEVQVALEQAYMLANDGKRPDTTSRMQNVGINDNFADLPQGNESQDSKDIAKRMGLSDEDKKKFVPGKVDLLRPNVGIK